MAIVPCALVVVWSARTPPDSSILANAVCGSAIAVKLADGGRATEPTQRENIMGGCRHVFDGIRATCRTQAGRAAVNAQIGRLKATIAEGIQKVAADVIVPFEQIGRLIAFCGEAFAARGLDVDRCGVHSADAISQTRYVKGPSEWRKGRGGAHGLARAAARAHGTSVTYVACPAPRDA